MLSHEEPFQRERWGERHEDESETLERTLGVLRSPNPLRNIVSGVAAAQSANEFSCPTVEGALGHSNVEDRLGTEGASDHFPGRSVGVGLGQNIPAARVTCPTRKSPDGSPDGDPVTGISNSKAGPRKHGLRFCRQKLTH